MRGKITGALSLIGLAVLLKNPQAHDALNQRLEDAARKLASWIPGAGRLRRRPTNTNSEAEPESLPEKLSPAPPAAGNRKRSTTARRKGTGPKKPAAAGKPKVKV
jgi:hypothetical protein